MLLRKELPNYINRHKCGSICWSLIEMYTDDIITSKEYRFLIDYIYDRNPNDVGNYSEYDDDDVIGFWWPYGELVPRLEFIDKLISEL